MPASTTTASAPRSATTFHGTDAQRDRPEQHRGNGQHDHRHQLACVLDVLDQHQFSGDRQQPERDQRRDHAAQDDRIPTRLDVMTSENQSQD